MTQGVANKAALIDSNGNPLDLGGGNSTGATLRVVLSSDSALFLSGPLIVANDAAAPLSVTGTMQLQVGASGLVFGPAPSAQSLPVVIASDQPPLPISGTVAVSNPVPVTLPPNAAQEGGGNLDAVANSHRLLRRISLMSLQLTAANSTNGFVPVEIPDFLGAL